MSGFSCSLLRLKGITNTNGSHWWMFFAKLKRSHVCSSLQLSKYKTYVVVFFDKMKQFPSGTISTFTRTLFRWVSFDLSWAKSHFASTFLFLPWGSDSAQLSHCGSACRRVRGALSIRPLPSAAGWESPSPDTRDASEREVYSHRLWLWRISWLTFGLDKPSGLMAERVADERLSSLIQHENTPSVRSLWCFSSLLFSLIGLHSVW